MQNALWTVTSNVDPAPIEVEFEHSTILRKRAEAYRKAHRIDDAMLLMSRVAAIQKGKSPKNYWRDKGLCLCDIGKYEQAVECFDKHLQLQGDSFDAYYAKGVVLYVLEIYEDALECLYKAYEMKYAEKLKEKAQISSLKSFKKFEDVIKHHNRPNSDNNNSQDYLLWYYIGLVLYHLGRYKEAAENLEKASKVKIESLVFYQWAKCELMLNQRDRCYDLLETANNYDRAISMMLRVDSAFNALRNEARFRILLDHRAELI